MLRKISIKIFLLSLLVRLWFNTPGICQSDEITNLINEIKATYCPDNRLSVFDVTASIKNDTLFLQGELLSPQAKSELIAKANELSKYIIEDRMVVLPDSASRQHPYGVIRLSVAQLRQGPDVDKEMISQAIMGAEVRLLKSGKHFFYYCQMEDGYLGWMMNSSFITGDESFINEWRRKEKLIVISLWGQVMEKPDDRSDPVSDLVRGNRLIKIVSRKGWYQVELPDGRQGYVKSNLVLEEKEYQQRYKPEATAIIRTAKSVLGHPYLWSGTSTKGFDCSGYIQSTFKFHGIQLQRDANMQIFQGEAVSMDDDFKYLKPGDLLFFGPQPEKITHVALYIGDYRFIHSDGFVHINSLNPEDDNYSDYRKRGLRAVRRILK